MAERARVSERRAGPIPGVFAGSQRCAKCFRNVRVRLQITEIAFAVKRLQFLCIIHGVCGPRSARWACLLQDDDPTAAAASPEQQDTSGWDPVWGDRCQQLVWIGVDPMDETALRAMLDGCLLTDEEMALGPERWAEELEDPLPPWAVEGEEDEGEWEEMEEGEAGEMEDMEEGQQQEEVLASGKPGKGRS